MLIKVQFSINDSRSDFLAFVLHESKGNKLKFKSLIFLKIMPIMNGYNLYR
jgi:hypothetical protein